MHPAHARPPQDELRALKAKYAAQYAPLYARRAAVVSGAAEVEANAGAAPDAEAPAGVPDFWLIALRNHEAFEALVSEKDAAVLAHLQDVGCEPVVGEVDADGDPLTGFLLTFTFGANPYFSNATLTKKYLFADEARPFFAGQREWRKRQKKQQFEPMVADANPRLCAGRVVPRARGGVAHQLGARQVAVREGYEEEGEAREGGGAAQDAHQAGAVRLVLQLLLPAQSAGGRGGG